MTGIEESLIWAGSKKNGLVMKTQATQKLVEILTDGIDVHRCAAARALGQVSQSDTTAALVAALMDEDPDVRVDAATALGQVKDPKTARKLMDNLIGDPDSEVKKAVIPALVAMKFTPVVPILRLLAVSRGAEEIAWDEGEFYETGWDNWADIQLAAIRGLGELGDEEAVPHIMKALADEMGQDVTEPAFKALAKMGESGAKALEKLFGYGNPRLCRRIARAVGVSDNPHLDALRAKMLQDESAGIRVLALGYLSSDDPRLAPLFGDEDAAVRAAAVRHAGLNNPALLWDMIEDKDPTVRTEVFKIIAANPDKFADDKLADAVKNAIKGDAEAARHAALALFALQGPKVAKGLTHVLNAPDVPREFRVGVLETLEKAGQVTVPALLEAAADPDRQLRLASMTTLANIAATDEVWPNAAGDGLLAALKGELVQPPVEEDDEEAENVEETEVPEEIAAEIDAETPLVATDAEPGSTLHAIMENKPDDAPEEEPEEIVLDADQERLLDELRTRKLNKRKISWETAVAPYLDVQRFSARLLGQLVHPDVTEALIAALDEDIDNETRENILFSLADHGSAGGELPASLRDDMLALLADESSEIRVLATRVLGNLPGEDIVNELELLLGHDDQLVRVEAIQSLDRRGVMSEALKEMLWDKYMGAGIATARAMARLMGPDAVDPLVNFAVRHDGTYRSDIGKLLAEYAPDRGMERLLVLLDDEKHRAHWLVAIDALAEIFASATPQETRMVA
jgi:HEAT repeat protein